MKRLIVLGSTGSVGTQTLKIAMQTGYKVVGLCAGSNVRLLNEQIGQFSPEFVAVYDKEAAKKIITHSSVKEIFIGEGSAEMLVRACNADIVLNAIVGIAGLCATIAALENGCSVALANKESLVAGGKLVIDAAKKSGARLLPVDSEHSAIFQCLQGNANKGEIEKIWLTASGGPFFGRNKNELTAVSVNEALNHPNWVMGNKITIDSATLMNKGLEFIEAAFLFDLRPSQIEIVVHRQSIVHSMVEFCDGAVLAQLGIPDMAVPIAYALSYPARFKNIAASLDFFSVNTLTFEKPDEETFCCLTAAKKALKKGGLAPCVLNGANEAAVSLFLNGKIGFLDIGRLVLAAVEDYKFGSDEYTLNDVLHADKAARRFVNN